MEYECAPKEKYGDSLEDKAVMQREEDLTKMELFCPWSMNAPRKKNMAVH